MGSISSLQRRLAALSVAILLIGLLVPAGAMAQDNAATTTPTSAPAVEQPAETTSPTEAAPAPTEAAPVPTATPAAAAPAPVTESAAPTPGAAPADEEEAAGEAHAHDFLGAWGVYLALIGAILALVFARKFYKEVAASDPGDPEMIE
ncbi:MAG: hypothetical protein JXO22_15450, partial [Phycisphaerae bacterium]|nr:hypothetical protein [Phycisphaerae bacterium]